MTSGHPFLVKCKAMSHELTIKPIARIQTAFADKFGIPRQGILASKSEAVIIFEPDYRRDGILNGIESFTHLWLLWGFSENDPKDWSVTVRPPKLGGAKKTGVFASRSPRRPNPIGLTAVRLIRVSNDPDLGPLLHVAGADMVNNTPIYDIKPYLPYCDSLPDAAGGYAKDSSDLLPVSYLNDADAILSKSEKEALSQVLSNDPRPGYHYESDRLYHIRYMQYDVAFRIINHTVAVTDITVSK